MNPSKLTNSILQKIEQEKITPRSKGYFMAKNWSFWSLFILSVLVGAASFAVILFALNHTDFAISEFVESEEVLTHWLTLLPVIWIFAIGVAVGIGMVGLKHTKRGYRIALFGLIGSNILGSLFLGGGIYAAGGGEIIEEVLEEHVAAYEGVRKKHQRFWGAPEDTGRLAGKITSFDPDTQTLTLEDPQGKEWTVPYAEAKQPQDFAPQVGGHIKMRGQVEDGEFKPQGVRPGGGRQQRIHKRIDDHFKRRPELRRNLETKLEPETRAALEASRERGERPTPELREQIRTEIRTNTTPTERRELKQEIRRETIKKNVAPQRRQQFKERLQNKVKNRPQGFRPNRDQNLQPTPKDRPSR